MTIKINNLINLLIIFNLILYHSVNFSATEYSGQDNDHLESSTETIDFNFKNKKLIDIVDMLTKLRNVNYIIPQNAQAQADFKQQVISYEPEDKKSINIKQAWDITTLFLELSGFSWFEKEKGLYEIVPTGSTATSGVTREPLPLYINTKPDDLPNNESRIKYVYYLTNLKISENRDDPLNQIFRDMSSAGAADPIILTKLNGFILVDKANIIASIINIVSRLDATGFRETIEIVPLYNVSAQDVAKVFDTLKKAAGEEKASPFIRSDTKASISYFASDTQIVADTRNNAIILMGRETAVSRMRDFIHNHVDTIEESGKSILHYYNLQYLSASEFLPILQDIVKTELQGSQGTQGPSSGPERKFQGVVIDAEKNIDIPPIQGPMDNETVRTPEGVKFDAKGITGRIRTGGNRLIIAAMPDDWTEIKKLIQQIDQPQPQVILEVLVADITHRKTKQISGAVRDIRLEQLPNGVGFLSSNITPVNNVVGATPTTLAQDLLRVISNSGTDTGVSSVSDLLSPGSLIVSFRDPVTPSDGLNSAQNRTGGGIWGLLAILDQYLDLKIITHPFLVSLNNTKATIRQSIVKRQRGDAVPSQSGVISVNIDDIPASIQVQMIPRISSETRLNLQIAVDIDNFLSDTSIDRETRRVETDSNLNSGDILVIGGLTRIDTQDSLTQTPILGQIPFIGRFFQGITKIVTTTNLAIFISPTIVNPRFRSGLDRYTEDKMRSVTSVLDDTIVYGDNRDPITYFFLPNRTANTNIIEEYLEQTKNMSEYQEEEIDAKINREENKLKRKNARKRNTKDRALNQTQAPIKEDATDVIA